MQNASKRTNVEVVIVAVVVVGTGHMLDTFEVRTNV